MKSLVADELGGLTESLPTCATLVILLPRRHILESGGPGAPVTCLLPGFQGHLPTRLQFRRSHPRVPGGRRRPGVFSLVDAEGVSADEILPAPLALDGLLRGVDPLVVHEAVVPVIGLLAQVALVALLPAVDPLVIQEAPFAGEGLPALLAPERLLASEDLRLQVRGAAALLVHEQLAQRVTPLVAGQVGAPAERLPALPAFVRLLTRVHPLVDEEERVVAEGFAAVAALEALLGGWATRGAREPSIGAAGGPGLGFSLQGVLLLVDEKGRPVGELFGALTAPVGLPARVHSLVVEERLLPREGFPTLLAQEGRLHRGGGALGLAAARGLPEVVSAFVLIAELVFLVHPLMAREVGPPPKGFPAFGTLVGFLLGMDPLMLKDIRLTVEGLPTLAAVEETVPTLVLQMIQPRAVRANFLALGRFQKFLVRVGLLVQMVGKHALEGLVTQAALVRFQPSVNPLVARAVRAPPESFPTHATLKRLLLSVEPLVVRKVRVVTEGPATVTALVQRPRHVQTPLVAGAREVFPVRILGGPLQRSVESLTQTEPADQAPEAPAILLAVVVVRAAPEVAAAAVLQGSLSSGNSQIHHVFETEATAASWFPRFFFFLETEAGLSFLNAHWHGIATRLLQAALRL